MEFTESMASRTAVREITEAMDSKTVIREITGVIVSRVIIKAAIVMASPEMITVSQVISSISRLTASRLKKLAVRLILFFQSLQPYAAVECLVS